MKNLLNKLKENEKLIELIMTIVFGVIGSLYIIYKISNALFVVLLGFAFITFGYKMKDPETSEVEETKHLEQLTIAKEEVTEPSIIKEVKKKVSKKVKA